MVTSVCMTPIHECIYYVLNDCSCHLQCGGSDTCLSCDCETEAQEALEGGDTSAQLGNCCLIRHRE